MRPLKTSQQMLTWLCLCPANEITSLRQRFNYILFTFVTLLFQLTALSGSVAYFLKFFSTNLEKSLYSIFHVAAGLSVIYTIIAVFCFRNKVFIMFTNLSKIYKANENNDSYRFLVQANENSEWCWKMYIKYVLGGFLISTFAMTITSVIVCYLIKGYFDTKYLYKPLKMSLPWNQESPLGYVAVSGFYHVSGSLYLFCNGTFFLLFISLCLHHRAFYQMFQRTLQKLNRLNKNQNRHLLGYLVDFNNSAKDWFLESSDIYRPIVLVQLICNMLLLTAAIFQLELQHTTLGLDLAILMIATFIGVTNLFLYCYFGKLATDSFEKMADCLFESNWQGLPIKLQKYFILMIANTQRPIYYHGFHMAVLDLETFCAFLRLVCTVFMMFRTLTTN